jgi:hypothetical protein
MLFPAQALIDTNYRYQVHHGTIKLGVLSEWPSRAINETSQDRECTYLRRVWNERSTLIISELCGVERPSGPEYHLCKPYIKRQYKYYRRQFAVVSSEVSRFTFAATMGSLTFLIRSRLELCLAFLPGAPVHIQSISRNCSSSGNRAVTRTRYESPRKCFMTTRHQPPPSAANASSASGAKSPSQELLYDPAIPTLSHAERARTIAASAADATLCTLSPDGFPYGSVVLTAIHDSGDPVLLISEMAEHTKNLHGERRCSLLIREAGPSNVLARGRVTLVGNARRVDKPTDIGDCFLRRGSTRISGISAFGGSKSARCATSVGLAE